MKSLKKVYLLSILILISAFVPAGAFAGESVITIESADSTNFEKNKETGEEKIILNGGVVVSVKRDDVSIKINAEHVSFDRKTEMLFAQENVHLVQSSSSQGNQDITASSVLINVSTLEGVFDDGRILQTQSDAINLPSGSVLVVASDLLGKDSNETIAFKKGELTFCDDENPHWKIKASNIWLLPGGEFAFFNALLYIGNIPILYLPAFYYPKDELIFNPSFGYDSRTGYYVNTTTYIYGRKPLTPESSLSSSQGDTGKDIGAALYNFMRPSELKEQVREGLVLHNLNESYTGNTSNYVKILADYYSNLGGMVGAEAVFNPKTVFTSVNASVRLGFTDTLFSISNKYTPYDLNGISHSDGSTFLGVKLPFRYSANLKLAMNKPFNLTLSMPIYSDPFVTQDFGNRSEYLDWIGFLMNGTDSDESTSSGSTITSFTWSLNASYNIPLSDIFKPYISTVSISDFSSSIAFGSRKNNDIDKSISSYSPERQFFSPSSVYPIKISGKISGTLLDINSSKTIKSKSKNISFPVELEVPDLISEKSKDESKEDDKAESSESDSSANIKNEKEASDFVSMDLPELSIPEINNSTFDFSGLTYSLSYYVSPNLTSQISYATDSGSPSEFNWGNIYSSYVNFQSPVNLSSAFSAGSKILSVNNTLAFSPVYQSHPNTDGYSESAAKSLKLLDYKARKLDLSGTNTVSVKPFMFNNVLKDSGLSWTSNIKYIRTKFVGDADNPEWEYENVDFKDTQSITTHTLTAKVSAEESSNFSQVLLLTTTLPPHDEKYDANLSFGFPFVNISFATGLKRQNSEWVKDPFQENLKVSLFGKELNFTQSYKYDLEDEHSDSLGMILSWKSLQLSYQMKYTNEYNYNSEKKKWEQGEKNFIPLNISLSYSSTIHTFKWYQEKVIFTPSVSSSLVYDFVKPTSSYFRFQPSLKFKVNNFIDINFSSETRNNVVYRYVQDLIGSDFRIAGETNVFKDLLDSFVFWGDGSFYDKKQTRRSNSGFKLKSLKLDITHDLHDWDLTSSYSITPRLTTGEDGKKKYDFSPSFSFKVTWRPLSSIKTEVVDEYGTWKFN